MTKKTGGISYRDAGVDIVAGDALVDAIKPLARSTFRDGCLGGLGGFGALFEIPRKFNQPILVAGTDGVGTKLKLAVQWQRHQTVGVDLVAMSANDVLVQGAEPLFFLDYFATGRLDIDTATSVVNGIAEGCRLAGAALIGGETAEMPGMYEDGDYDLAGFCVGAVERDRLIDGRKIDVGDLLIGLPSSGPHANGYSLIRRLIADKNVDPATPMGASSLEDALMTPTRVYVRPVLNLLQRIDVHGLAHITGGGITGNISRVLPAGCQAVIDGRAWRWPEIFEWIQQAADIGSVEMYHTFNCGIGMVIIVSDADADSAVTALHRAGERPLVIGRIDAARGKPMVTIQ